tara:strand:+ start:9386 stop:10135 length:750 start_codon:yes stop_codon:yes gene_type:complete
MKYEKENNKSNNISKLIPNGITMLALCSGITSIRYSISEEWKIAALFIIFASILDFFDGWVAKKLMGGSHFGAELDNLSDIISFGVAPSILIYYWSLQSLNSLGWAISLFFVICAALRLARFTTDIYLSDEPINKSKYFVGIPSPAAAGLILFNLFAFFQFEYSFLINPYFNSIVLIIVGIMMITKIPTISPKNLSVKNNQRTWLILGIAIVSIGLISNIWITLMIALLLYLFSVIYTIKVNFKKIKMK